MLDVGPLLVAGGDEPLELVHNPGQSGAYTTAGGDGTVAPGTLVGGTTYTLSGDGDSEQGLGAFAGEIFLPPMFTLTSPPVEPDPLLPISIINVDTTQDLVLSWDVVASTGPSGILNISLAGASLTGEGGGVSCRATDDGEFTISADMVAAVNLGDNAFFNVMTVEREGPEGTMSGEGITVAEVGSLQTFSVNMQPWIPTP